MKRKSILITTLVLILLSFCLSAIAQVKYLGSDVKTQGDWIGKKVSVYALDFDTTARKFQAFGWQGKDMPADPDEEIEKYTDGVYLTWEVTGKDPFQFYQKNGTGSVNCVISAVFVDGTTSVEQNGKVSTLWGSIKNMQ